jgi:hypothetical protein
MWINLHLSSSRIVRFLFWFLHNYIFMTCYLINSSLYSRLLTLKIAINGTSSRLSSGLSTSFLSACKYLFEIVRGYIVCIIRLCFILWFLLNFPNFRSTFSTFVLLVFIVYLKLHLSQLFNFRDKVFGFHFSKELFKSRTKVITRILNSHFIS